MCDEEQMKMVITPQLSWIGEEKKKLTFQGKEFNLNN